MYIIVCIFFSSRAIQKNQDLLPETPITDIFYDDFWGTPLTHSGSHKSYRPLCVLSFRLNYFLGQLSPWGYHAVNVVLHVLVTAVFTYYARLVFSETRPTLIAGLIFASHPVHSEAVAGIVGRADIGACLFYLIAILAYMKYVELRQEAEDSSEFSVKKWFYFALCACSTTASMLTKEIGVTVIGVCAAYDVFVFHKLPLYYVLSFKWVSVHAPVA